MQIWLTYSEIADFLSRSTDDARIFVADRNLSRRRSRDGLTRIKLNSELMAIFVERLRAPAHPDHGIDVSVAELRAIHQKMAAPVMLEQRAG